MSRGTWLAYCDRRRLIPLDAVGRHLASHGELAPRLDPAGKVLVVEVHDTMTGNVADIAVSIDTGPHVALEAAELAESLTSGRIPIDEGVPIPDAAALARTDARYEITWDLRRSDETYNAMMWIAGILMEECGAIVFDSTNHRFV